MKEDGGQSFRFGSTVNNSAIPNSWSKAGENGSQF